MFSLFSDTLRSQKHQTVFARFLGTNLTTIMSQTSLQKYRFLEWQKLANFQILAKK